MGFWGAALFSNDTTCDVRDTYGGFLSDQLSNEEAYMKTLERNRELIKTDEEPLFWYALAETQWRVGRLLPNVKITALEWIERGGGVDFWEENLKGREGWLNTLQRLRAKLETPMPKEKYFPKFDYDPWDLDDVYAYQLHELCAEKNGLAGKYMLLQKIGAVIANERGKTLMQLHVIDHVFDDAPNLDDMMRYRILPMDDLNCKSLQQPLSMNGYVSFYKKPSEYPKKYLTFLGNKRGQVNKHFAFKDIGWLGLEYQLCHNYGFWRGKEYDEIEVGIYNCSIHRDNNGYVIG